MNTDEPGDAFARKYDALICESIVGSITINTAATTTEAQGSADIYGDIQRALDGLRRTIACHPSRAEAIRADLARRNVPFVEVVEFEHVPDNVLYLWPTSLAESVRGTDNTKGASE